MTADPKSNVLSLQSILAHKKDVVRFLRNRLSNPNDVDDVAQEVWVRWLQKGNHDAIDDHGAFLIGIANNVAADWCRSKAIRGKHVTTDSELVEQEGEQTFEQEIGDFLALGHVTRAFDTLSLNERRVVYLWIEGFSCEESANRLNLSCNTVTKYRAQSIAKIKRRLASVLANS